MFFFNRFSRFILLLFSLACCFSCFVYVMIFNNFYTFCILQNKNYLFVFFMISKRKSDRISVNIHKNKIISYILVLTSFLKWFRFKFSSWIREHLFRRALSGLGLVGPTPSRWNRYAHVRLRSDLGHSRAIIQLVNCPEHFTGCSEASVQSMLLIFEKCVRSLKVFLINLIKIHLLHTHIKSLHIILARKSSESINSIV